MKSNPTEKLDYRRMLQRELEQRRSKNPSYSLRAFAASLDLSAPFLSQIVSGQKRLSQDRAFLVLQKIKWSYRQKQLFLSLVKLEGSKDANIQKLSLRHAKALSEIDFIDLKEDQFKLVAEWYYFAIAELTAVKGFREEAQWIARRLNISPTLVEEALQKLLRLGIVTRDRGRLRKSESYGINDVPSLAIQTFHRHHLRRASLALDSQKFNDREFTGQTLSFERQKFSEVKEYIREFHQKMNQYSTDLQDPDSVFHLAIQFYRLDEAKKEKT